MTDFRCRRDSWCSDKQPVFDPVTGEHLGWVGADIDSVDGLCPRCVGEVDDALIHLPLDVAELTKDLGRPLSIGEQENLAHAKPGSSPPIRVELEALRALIVHETVSWAVAVGRDLDLPINQFEVAHSRLGFRVKVSCMVLRANLPTLLALGPTEYRARSLGTNRAEGRPDELVTRYGDDCWTTRDGIEGALLLLQLHRKAWSTAKRHTAPLPTFVKCPNCRQFAVRRYPGDTHGRCMVCRHPVSEQHLDVLRAVASRINTAADREAVAAIFKPVPTQAAS
jgi:hypothetical protein